MAAPARARRIAIVDYHKGNLSSVLRSVTEAGGDASVVDDPAAIAAADAVVVPGVGAFEDAMDYLRASGEADAMPAAMPAAVKTTFSRFT